MSAIYFPTLLPARVDHGVYAFHLNGSQTPFQRGSASSLVEHVLVDGERAGKETLLHRLSEAILQSDVLKGAYAYVIPARDGVAAHVDVRTKYGAWRTVTMQDVADYFLEDEWGACHMLSPFEEPIALLA